MSNIIKAVETFESTPPHTSAYRRSRNHLELYAPQYLRELLDENQKLREERNQLIDNYQRACMQDDLSKQEIERLMQVNIIRPELQWFSKRMEAKLQENDHKAHWYKLHQDYLIHRLYQEAGELWNAIRNEPAENIVKEAADVANFAMMIADNAERMIRHEPSPHPS